MRSETVTVVSEAPLIQAQSGERSYVLAAPGVAMPSFQAPESRERYASVEPGRFHRVSDDPLSTFGADVDTASFANARRFLQSGQLPPIDAVLLNSPWLSLHRSQPLKAIANATALSLGGLAPDLGLGMLGPQYGQFLHRAYGGEWDFSEEWKVLHEQKPWWQKWTNSALETVLTQVLVK